MSRLRPTACALLLVALATATRPGTTCAAPPPSPAPPPPRQPVVPKAPKEPAIPTVVHVPIDELDTLVRAQGRSILLRYDEYRALLDAAGANDADARSLPSLDVVPLSAEGTLDLTDERGARFTAVYRLRGLAPGPRSTGFAAGGLAFESVRVEAEGGRGTGPLRGARRARAHLPRRARRPARVGGRVGGALDGGHHAALRPLAAQPRGDGARAHDSAGRAGLDRGRRRAARRPVSGREGGRGSRAADAAAGISSSHWAPSAKGSEGPTVIDAEVRTLYTLGDGVVAVRALVRADVLRTPTDTLTLDVPPDLAVHAIEGPGITGFVRSEDRTRVSIRLEKPTLGRVEALVQGERAHDGRGGHRPPAHRASRTRRGTAAWPRSGSARTSTCGRCASTGVGGVPEPGTDEATKGVLRYALDRADARLTVDVEPGALRVDATGTYYLNLAEPGQTLLAMVTYRVAEGTLFRAEPALPARVRPARTHDQRRRPKGSRAT